MQTKKPKLKPLYLRYYPDPKRRTRHLYQWKVGKLGKSHRVAKGGIGVDASMRREMESVPGKWFLKGYINVRSGDT